ncbi:hypothetical protein ALC60_03723 [Trachymyrmex zeteki]|uniref:Uncharacterized protein n=1 Tax=Mycetomoellerius zeteki TaxID=64791 RepID=A0A151XAL5_9HYME|nr:hypothetical protein ALC60_03723 [Trachymyrmex zeteki]
MCKSPKGGSITQQNRVTRVPFMFTGDEVAAPIYISIGRCVREERKDSVVGANVIYIYECQINPFHCPTKFAEAYNGDRQPLYAPSSFYPSFHSASPCLSLVDSIPLLSRNSHILTRKPLPVHTTRTHCKRLCMFTISTLSVPFPEVALDDGMHTERFCRRYPSDFAGDPLARRKGSIRALSSAA